MNRREINYQFAVDFVAAGGNGHPASLYLVALFREALSQAQQEREQRFSTGSDWGYTVWQAKMIADCVEQMLARSTMLSPSELVGGYVRETMAGSLPIDWEKIPILESSILQHSWNGLPLVTTRLTRIKGEKTALNSGSHRLTCIRRLHEAEQLPDTRQRSSVRYARALGLVLWRLSQALS